MAYWSEIRNDYFNNDVLPEDGDVIAAISIDAWKTGEEQGSVIARVLLSKHGDVLVDYHDPMARIDEGAQQVILEAKEQLKAYSLEREVVPQKHTVYCLCETHEHGDAIREFEILAVSTDKDALRQLMQAKVTADEYGYLKDNGIYEHSEDWISTNYKDGFVEYSIVETRVSSRDEVLRESAGYGLQYVRSSLSGNPLSLSEQIREAAVFPNGERSSPVHLREEKERS